MRSAILAIMVALPSIAIAVMLTLTITYHGFRRVVAELRTPDDLRRLRSLAKLQMYLSLLGHPALSVGGVIVVWIAGWLMGEVGWLDLLLFGVLPIAATIAVAFIGTSPADMAKTIPAADESIAEERDRIVEIWINRLVPNW